MSIKNEFMANRTAKATFALVGNLSAASTLTSGVIIPKGAIVTGIRTVVPSAVTVTGASGTLQIAVGGVNIAATANVSAIGAVTVPGIKALATTAGNYLTADSEIKIIEGASNNAAATVGAYDIYVDYIYA